jgi:hypothetical protein
MRFPFPNVGAVYDRPQFRKMQSARLWAVIDRPYIGEGDRRPYLLGYWRDSRQTRNILGMTRIHLVLLTSVAFLLSPLPSFAHHAFASEFDETKIVKFKGTVTLIARMNPHGLIFVDARNDKGDTEHWAIETLSALQMDAYGLGVKGSLTVGDKLEVCGFATKDGVEPMKSYQSPEPISLSLKSIPRPIFTGRLMFASSLTLPDGRKLLPGQGKCGN